MKECWNVLNMDEAKKEIAKLLAGNDWKDYFCIGGHGEKIKYTTDEKTVAKIAAAAGHSGTIYTENEAIETIKEALMENIDAFTEWVKSRSKSMRFYYKAKDAIGYVVNEDGTKTDSSKFMIYAMKELNDNTKCGFFVCGITPVAE